MDGELPALVDRFVNEPNLYYHGQLLYVWAHTYEFEHDNSWDRIEGVFKKLSECGEIWYATNTEIYDYVKAFRGLVYYADMKRAYNPATVDVYLRCDDGRFMIPSGGEADI